MSWQLSLSVAISSIVVATLLPANQVKRIHTKWLYVVSITVNVSD